MTDLQTDRDISCDTNVGLLQQLFNKKLSCRRDTARCFISLNFSLSTSFKITQGHKNGTIRKLGYGFLFAFCSNV